MPRFDRIAGIATAVSSAALLLGCAASQPGFVGNTASVAPYPPPPQRAEIPPPAPSTESLWLVGHWNWNGAKYVWTRGAYVQRPEPTVNWMPGYWQEQSAGWIWTDGHWQS